MTNRYEGRFRIGPAPTQKKLRIYVKHNNNHTYSSCLIIRNYLRFRTIYLITTRKWSHPETSSLRTTTKTTRIQIMKKRNTNAPYGPTHSPTKLKDNTKSPPKIYSMNIVGIWIIESNAKCLTNSPLLLSHSSGSSIWTGLITLTLVSDQS